MRGHEVILDMWRMLEAEPEEKQAPAGAPGKGPDRAATPVPAVDDASSIRSHVQAVNV